MTDQPGRVLTDGELSDVMFRRRRREEHSDPRSIAFISRLGIPPDATCLEVGAGLGSLARWMATSLAPTGLVWATEVQPELVQSIGEAAPPNLKAIRHDIVTDPPPGQSYDLIHARFVLEHLPSRDRVLRSLASMLSPGGWLVIEDALITMAILDGPGPYLEAMTSFARHRAGMGSDYTWARNLPGHFRQLRLGGIRAQRVADIFESGSGLGAFWAAVLQQEPGPANATHDAASPACEAVALLCAGSEWFSGPHIIQCAGRRESGTTERSRP
ncbi:MAG: class I SAM-dependent methyltransferase [Streptosporangiaceae bacterium]